MKLMQTVETVDSVYSDYIESGIDISDYMVDFLSDIIERMNSEASWSLISTIEDYLSYDKSFSFSVYGGLVSAVDNEILYRMKLRVNLAVNSTF